MPFEVHHTGDDATTLDSFKAMGLAEVERRREREEALEASGRRGDDVPVPDFDDHILAKALPGPAQDARDPVTLHGGPFGAGTQVFCCASPRIQYQVTAVFTHQSPLAAM